MTKVIGVIDCRGAEFMEWGFKGMLLDNFAEEYQNYIFSKRIERIRGCPDVYSM